jgi:hypothetical protein
MDALRKLSAIGVACFVALALSLSAVATTSVGSFEIDGNRADDSGPGDLILDWDSPPPNVAKFNDASGQGDDIFGIGSKELEPGGWQCVTGSAPGKDDFVNGEVAFRTLKGKQHLYVDFQRAATNGDAHMDYEFNQSREPNPACPALPKRTPGDILIAFDTANGGKAIAVRAFRWQGNAVSGSFVELQLGSKGVLWDGAVNIPNTIPGLEPGAFGEAALNLTDTIGQIGCAIFSTVYMKTRASTSITAELKDRTAALPVNFAIDRPDLANASGGALGAHVRSTLLGIDQTLVPVSTRQSGVGSRSAQDELLNVVVPSDGSLLRADVVRGSAKSTVTATPAEAVHTSTAETANVKILNGLVTASAVRAVATARANGSSSSFSSLGSAFKDLAVQGVAMNDVTPNTRIDLPAELYGPGSRPALRACRLDLESSADPDLRGHVRSRRGGEHDPRLHHRPAAARPGEPDAGDRGSARRRARRLPADGPVPGSPEPGRQRTRLHRERGHQPGRGAGDGGLRLDPADWWARPPGPR